jgi:hypothetical protein
MSCNALRRVIAIALVMPTVALPLYGPAPSAGTGSVFQGRVVAADGLTPRAGVVVRLVSAEPARTLASAPTNDEGRFRIDVAPPGTYTLEAEAHEGLYVLGERLAIHEGPNTPLQLTLKNLDAAPDPAAPRGGAGDLSPVVKGVIAGVLVVAAFFLLDDATEDEASAAVPF